MRQWIIARWAILIIGSVVAMAAEIATQDVTRRLAVGMAWGIGVLIIAAASWIVRSRTGERA